MFKAFEASTADAAWQQIVNTYRSGGFQSDQISRSGNTSELLHASITISDPRQRWVASRRPALNVAFALAEIVWIVRGRNDSAFLNFFNRELPKYAGTGPIYHGAYGYRFRKAFGFDQLERAYSVLKTNPDSRQVVLQIWNPQIDFPDAEGQPAACDIPCNIAAFLKVRAGRLEWLQVMRSNDVFRGLPYNLVQFTSLQEIMAGWLGLDLGEYHHISDSLHVYDNTAHHVAHSPPMDIGLNREELAVPREISDAAFRRLEQIVEIATAEGAAPEEIEGLCVDKALPGSYQNFARVLCAEAGRRHGHLGLAQRIMSKCSSELLNQLYNAWLARVEGDRIRA